MKISLNQFLKLQEIFPQLEFEKDHNEIHFRFEGSHYYITRNGYMWCVYQVYRYGSLCGRVTDLGTNFKTMVDNFKTWLKNMGDIS